MAYTDFCIRSGGSNLNAGTRTGNSTVPGTAADLTYASGTLVQSTGVFTVASGDPAADGVAVGDFASVYPDGSTVGVCIGKITARSSTTITISTTILMGAMPTDGTTNRTVKIGGAWEGPSGTTQFPLNLATIGSAIANTGDVVCINAKSDVVATMTAAITTTANGAYQISGFASAYRDEAGKWELSGATTGASYVPWTVSGTLVRITDIKITNNGATGSAAGLAISGSRTSVERASVSGMRGTGIALTGVSAAKECEAYGCNTSNTSASGGMTTNASGGFIRCYCHGNTGSNNSGVVLSGNSSQHLTNCVIDSNETGVWALGGVLLHMIGCDLYNNVTGLLANSGTPHIIVENSNFIKNSTAGVSLAVAGEVTLYNCGFPAAGTTANGTDTTSSAGVIVNTSPVTITANTTPWNAPTTGDFRIVASGNKNTGRGVFTQLRNSKTGTVGAPDIGAAQSTGSGSGGLIGGGNLNGGFL